MVKHKQMPAAGDTSGLNRTQNSRPGPAFLTPSIRHRMGLAHESDGCYTVMDADDYPAFEDNQPALMKQIVEVMEPLKLATDSAQGLTAHIEMVLPMCFKLLKLLRGGTKQLAKVAIAARLSPKWSSGVTGRIWY